jgi:hypothetical protein
LAQSIAAVIGWAVLLGAGAAAVVALGRRAAALGVLAPVAVGLGLRLVVMGIAHAGSLSLGDDGILFLDDRTYLNGAGKLADFWRDGQTPDPSRFDILGTYQFGYQIFLTAIFTLGTDSVLLGKLANVLLGGVTVYLVARIAGRVLGSGAEVRAAWLAALAPTLVWWSAPMMKEALATALLAGGILAATYLPRPRAMTAFAAIVCVLAVVRGSAALALVVGAGMAVAIATRQAKSRWRSLRSALVAVGLVGGLLVYGVAVSQGNLDQLYRGYDMVVRQMIDNHQGGDLTRVPYDVVKSLVTPLPWVFDSGTRNWDRALFPGMWLLFCAYPIAAVGAWRLRHRPELWLLLCTASTAVVVNAVTAGFVFRQRSMVEPFVLLLALAGAPSWRFAGRWAAGALAAVAVVAAIQSGSPVPPLVILAAATAVLLATSRAPSRPYEPLPHSPLVEGFRPSDRPPVPLLAALRAAAASGRAAVLRHAPQAGARELRQAPVGQGPAEWIRRALAGVRPEQRPDDR